MQPNTPADCALAIVLPQTRNEFYRDVQAQNKDFVRSWMSRFEAFSIEFAWQEYKRYADLVTDVIQEAGKAGVMVKLQATLADWLSLLPRFPVVSLVAHCTGGNPGDPVEFADGLRQPEEIVAAIPSGYVGTIDLTVCFSLHLAPYIKRSFPHCTTIANKHQAQLDHRIAIYRQTLWLLKTGNYAFVDAMKEVQLAILSRARAAAHEQI